MKIKDRAKPSIPPVPAGGYLAVCVGVFDLGEQYSEKYKNYSPKLMITFDLPSVTIEVDGKQEPRQLSREFTISGKNNSKLRAFISSWNGVQYSDEAFGEFDPLTQIGKPAMINVLLNETGEYANIDSIMPVFPGLPVPTTSTKMQTWDMDTWDDKAFAELPVWVQEKIKKSSQYQKEHAPDTTVAVTPPAGIDFAALMAQNNAQAASQQEACPI
ncbi:MAG: phage replication initiation protein, NGO0469 family [Faecousia sp.]